MSKCDLSREHGSHEWSQSPPVTLWRESLGKSEGPSKMGSYIYERRERGCLTLYDMGAIAC